MIIVMVLSNADISGVTPGSVIAEDMNGESTPATIVTIMTSVITSVARLLTFR